MSGAYTLSTTFIKESDVTNTELAEIGERLSEFPGIKLGTSWSRQYPEGNEFKTLVGTVTNEATGLPEDRLHTLLAQGYSQNEPVGNSSLEKDYESILKKDQLHKRLLQQAAVVKLNLLKLNIMDRLGIMLS